MQELRLYETKHVYGSGIFSNIGMLAGGVVGGIYALPIAGYIGLVGAVAATTGGASLVPAFVGGSLFIVLSGVGVGATIGGIGGWVIDALVTPNPTPIVVYH